QAAQALQQAGDAQRAAAQATGSQDGNNAAANQNQSAQKLADAEQALGGQRAQNGNAAGQKPGQNPSQNNGATAQNSQGAQPGSQNNPGQGQQPGAAGPTSPIGMNGAKPDGTSPNGQAQGGTPSGEQAAAQSVQDARSSQAQAMKGDSGAAQQAAQ